MSWALPAEVTPAHAWLLQRLLTEQLKVTLRYERGLTYDVEVSTENYQDCRLFTLSVEVPPEDLPLTQDLLWQALRAPTKPSLSRRSRGSSMGYYDQTTLAWVC
jgi:hypothetical protein